MLLLDESDQPFYKVSFTEADGPRLYQDSREGNAPSPMLELSASAAKSAGIESLWVETPQLREALLRHGLPAEVMDDARRTGLAHQKIALLVHSGLVPSEQEAIARIRAVALAASEAQLRELQAQPDLQAMQAVQALDEVDKTANLLGARLREWYGLHFPELEQFFDDSAGYARFVEKVGRRDNLSTSSMQEFALSPKKSEAILTAAAESKGGQLRPLDSERIQDLAVELLRQLHLRERLAKHVEDTMAQIAPNVAEVAGATIGARLIAKVGGLRRLAMLPSSTIQILGAEKALFRALRTGARPPKHGLLFQHQAVHSAPRWQRGKIARTLASKIAIAARIDAFRGRRDERLGQQLEERLREIRSKYAQPPEAPARPPPTARARAKWKKKRR